MPLCAVSIAVFLFEQEWHWQQRSCYCTVITLGGFPELFPANAVSIIQKQEKDSVIKKEKKEKKTTMKEQGLCIGTVHHAFVFWLSP